VAKEWGRDRSVERLLQATSRSAVPESLSPACLDAGAIASWAEATLGPDEAARVEAHLAECQRCQAVLAAFARAEPPAAPAAPVWKRWTAVLLPIAAGIAAVVMWTAWPLRRPPVPPVATVAEAPRVAGAPGVTEAPRAAESAPQPAPVSASSPPAVAANSAGTPTRPRGAIAADAVGATKSVAPSMSPSPVFRSIAPPAATPVPLVAPPPPAAAQAPPLSAQAPTKPVVVGGSPLRDAQVSASAALQRVADGVRAAPEPIVTFDSPAALGGDGSAAAAAAGGRGGGARPAALRQAALSSSVTHWRILASRDLERSTDDGRTWERVAIDPPSTVTNGAAPSALVCWLVGRAGVVLVTNDASHFTRLGFPETVDLSAVQATDALNATVTTIDGRTFVTADGGKTWTQKRLLTPHETG
jgi:hypothetical protein